MSESKPNEPGRKTGAEGRRARQAEALRANLFKRKTQAKARKTAAPAADPQKNPDGNQS
jgi:hypothetical protein